MLNKKLGYIFVFIVLSLFIISACEQTVGRKINRNAVGNGEVRLSCGSNITEDTKLGGNLLNCQGGGLVIIANDVVLDCNGYKITRNYNQRDYNAIRGIDVLGSRVSITGCDISGFDIGILLNRGSSGATLTRNTVSGGFYGIYLGAGSSGATLTRNTISGNKNGILLDTTSYNTLTRNTVSGNKNGVSVYCNIWYPGSCLVLGNLITDNIINDNTLNGIDIEVGGFGGGESNQILRNTLQHNGNGLLMSFIAEGVPASVILRSNTICNSIENDVVCDNAKGGANFYHENTCDTTLIGQYCRSNITCANSCLSSRGG